MLKKIMAAMIVPALRVDRVAAATSAKPGCEGCCCE